MITTKAQAVATARTRATWWGVERAWMAVLVVLTLLLALVNLPYSPRSWFDEGSILHVPKTLLQYGVYADISSEGFRYYGPTIGVGPTLMLPVALAFKLFGVGLLQARLVVTAYLLIAMLAAFLLARRMHGVMVALLCCTLLLASRTLGNDGLIEYGREALGEVPGMAFLLLGTLFWLQALQAAATQRRWLYSGLAGLGFGLALVTKNQFVLVVPPALLLASVLDWRYYRAGSWPLRLVPLLIACACFGLWTLAQFQFFGPGSFVENMRQTRQAAGGAIFVFDLRATLRAGYYVLRPDLFGGLLIPSLVYALWRARRRDAQGLAEMLIVLIVGLWLTWYVGASLGWPRYAFPAVVFGALLVARALADLLAWLWRPGRRWMAWAVAAYIVLLVALPLSVSARAILQPDMSTQQFAAYLDASVPQDAIVETWEPELGVLTDHRYHYPPIALLDTAVRHEWLGGPPLVYDGLQDAPPYVVLGRFGMHTRIYSEEQLARDYVILQQIGTYTLYQRR